MTQRGYRLTLTEVIRDVFLERTDVPPVSRFPESPDNSSGRVGDIESGGKMNGPGEMRILMNWNDFRIPSEEHYRIA